MRRTSYGLMCTRHGRAGATIVSFAGAAVLLAVWLAVSGTAGAAGVNPLLPPDRSSPRATLEGFIAKMDEAYRESNEWMSAYVGSNRLYLNTEEHQRAVAIRSNALAAARSLDATRIPPVLKTVVSAARIIQLKEILDRIELPPLDTVPDQDAMSRSAAKRWRLPNTEIDIALITDGPQSGEYLFSADTVDRIPAFYARVKDLPYRPGPAKELADTYRAVAGNKTATVYEMFSNSPVGLDRIVPTRWMLNLPEWTKSRLFGLAIWQWLGMTLGFLIAALLIFGVNWLAYHFVRVREEVRPGWHSLATPAAILIVVGLLVPLLSTIFRISGNPRMVLNFAQTIVVCLCAAWLCMMSSGVLAEAIVTSERLASRSLDGQLIRLGLRFFGLVAALAIIMQAANDLGFPAYSVLAGLGVGGLAVALAARDSLANLLGSILIMFEKPFRVGHRIKVGGVEGLVEDVGFRSTRLRTRDDSIISIPNNSIVNTTIENRSLRVNRRQRLVLQVTYDTPNEKMMLFARRMKECINEHPLTNKDNFRSFDDSGIAFNDFGESSLNIIVTFYLIVTTGAVERGAREEILFKIRALAEDIGIDFAFPTRTLHVETTSAAPKGSVPSPEAANV